MQPLSEIRSFLSHGDHSLAVRRLLDTALDSGDAALLQESIDLSKHFRAGATDFETRSLQLLEKLAQRPGPPQTMGKPLLEAKDISKTYSKGNFSLQPIQLSIATGDVLGVVGQNGNGKTTLLRCLAGQLSVDQGSIQYAQLKRPDHYAIKHHVAFIPQRIPRWYGQLKDNLHFSASLSEVKGAENEVMVDFMLERLGLSTYAHLNWNQISSGYRTRFELARILLQKPSLLILDEPLANLDINAQQTILTDLRYMAKSAFHPMGVVLSSQQLHEVEKVADTVLMIRNGACIHKTGEKQDAVPSTYVMELETTASREQLLGAIDADGVQLHFNGGFYTITTTTLTAQEIITRLVQQQIPVNYFRDITHSTKRFF